MIPARMTLATLRNLGFSCAERFRLVIDLVNVSANQSRTCEYALYPGKSKPHTIFDKTVKPQRILIYVHSILKSEYILELTAKFR